MDFGRRRRRGSVGCGSGSWSCRTAAGTSTSPGLSGFDSTDETADWAAYPYAWRPDGGYLPFPDAGVLAASEAVAEAVVLVRALAPWEDLPVDGVAAGFDDGDFEIVYAR
jgi:hypothetical protein